LERRRQGLCYNCDEPFVRGHQCERLFYLESSDYIDDEGGPGDAGVAVGEEEVVPVDALANALVVSLHAVAGIPTENTMVVSTTIQGQRLLALLDMGSTPTPPPTTVATVAAADTGRPLLDRLLQQHAGIFTEPQGLPPARPYDHRIHLLPGTAPVAVRPYRYPQLQKDELERQCAAMLAQGIIRPSTTPFSAPVLLVRKPDESWRFCIDYLKGSRQYGLEGGE
jgi:hypothetical protein